MFKCHNLPTTVVAGVIDSAAPVAETIFSRVDGKMGG